MGTQDDKAPIELAASRPRPRRREVTREVSETPDPDQTPDPDAPKGKATRTGSDYVRGLVDTVLTTAKNPKPSEADLRKLNAEVTALAILAEKGLGLLGAVGGGNGSGRGGVLVTVLVAAGVALGVPNLTGSNDALAEAIAGRIDAQDSRLDQTDARIVGLEENMETFRYAIGKLIEYQIQDNYHGCERDEKQIRALNWIAGQMPRVNEDGEKYETTTVKCEQNPLLNEDLTDLLNYARRMDNAR